MRKRACKMELNLAENDVGPLTIQSISLDTSITALKVSKNLNGEEATTLSHSTTITSLNLSSSKIGAEGAKALAHSTTITSLHLWGNKIGAEGAKALSHNTTITSLNLSANN